MRSSSEAKAGVVVGDGLGGGDVDDDHAGEALTLPEGAHVLGEALHGVGLALLVGVVTTAQPLVGAVELVADEDQGRRGEDPASAREAARLASGASATSWPPVTSASRGQRPAPAKAGSSVTSPSRPCAPAARTARPVATVVATDPRAPTSHSPVRSGAVVSVTWVLLVV